MVQRPTSTDRRRYGTSGYVLLVLCVLALAAVVAQPASGGKDRVKEINTRLSVEVTPNPYPPSTTSLTVVGRLTGRRGCEERRTVRFEYAADSAGVDQPLPVTARSNRQGEFSAILPKPTSRRSRLVSRVNSVKRRTKIGLVRCDRVRNDHSLSQLVPRPFRP